MLLILLLPLSWLRSTTTTRNMSFLMLAASYTLPNVHTIPARKSFWTFCTKECFRKYLVGVHFTLETDHANLRWLMSANHQAGRLARWILRLQELDFTIRHNLGKANTNVDALSRLQNDTFVKQTSKKCLCPHC